MRESVTSVNLGECQQGRPVLNRSSKMIEKLCQTGTGVVVCVTILLALSDRATVFAPSPG